VHDTRASSPLTSLSRGGAKIQMMSLRENP
jgi:hypothetical protein